MLKVRGWWSRDERRAIRGRRLKEMEVQRDITLYYVCGALLNIYIDGIQTMIAHQEN